MFTQFTKCSEKTATKMLKKSNYFIIATAITLVIIFAYIFNSEKRQTPYLIEIIEAQKMLEIAPIRSNFHRKIFNLTLNHTLQPSPCAKSSDEVLLAVIMVTSYHGNMELRSAMRRAFSEEDLQVMGLRRIFLLGQKPIRDNFTTQEAINAEQMRFGDILQGNFIEAYRNLTFKHLMGLKWTSENCFRARYLIKMDDDIVVNLRQVVQFLQTKSLPSVNLLAGYVFDKMSPIRRVQNKWFVSEAEFKPPFYPKFVSGWFYVTTPHLASKLVSLAHFYDYFWIDDVFVTGILAQRLKVKHFDIGRFFTVYPEFLKCCIKDLRRDIKCDIMVGPNGGDNNLFYEFNTELAKCFAGGGRKRCLTDRMKPLSETCVAERIVSIGKGNANVEAYNLH